MNLAGRIGPNAIIRVAEVLPSRVGTDLTRRLFDRAGMANYLSSPPQAMVDETEVCRLHGVLRESLGTEAAGEIAHAAGVRTADYLLARRIPKPVQALLKVLPAPLAARVLLTAIGRNSWTFAGSGHFAYVVGRPCVLTIRDNPLCRGWQAEKPACDFYAGTFERLFTVLVHRNAQVTEVACEACGDAECRFEITW
ncbi:bacteriochlorophyll 4-vinyl reductase [Rubrivivax gelatinosus]|uniref:Bacteriochlorophyll 4-vinyl reductase n=1 Tax=Rubrivivax gelatinosus TaxID=28068 RepID=A0ABS1E2Z0_RUBGE|nr:bacteriochlorophyll 4-vinyl reductase [Rubrivivax gelatinosus]MBK1715290.1 bacteriochlorophyll 4-vinyl reductase [Rubrivivax gelatinosus]